MKSIGDTLDVAYVGAGAIHFGGAEGPWDHSARLEHIPGLRFTAIVDPDLPKAKVVLSQKLSGNHGDLYKDCVLYKGLDDLYEEKTPDVVLIGIPPAYRGSAKKGRDLELAVLSKGSHLFVEKPMSVEHSSDFNAYVETVEKVRLERNLVVSVGYMFRYHAAVLKMKDLITAHGGKVMLCNGRYYTAYSELDHPFWWDINKSGGPIVEQATHFCDLARFLVGDVDLASVRTTCLRDDDASGAGHLASVSTNCEEHIDSGRRIPRIHVSTWRFKAGGIGTLSHAVALHGKQYETSLDVLMDGLRMTLYEPYTAKCKLLVRDGRTGSDEEQVYHFGTDDPYKRELETFIDAVRTKNSDSLSSTYTDAAKTYQFSWAIRLAGEAGH